MKEWDEINCPNGCPVKEYCDAYYEIPKGPNNKRLCEIWQSPKNAVYAITGEGQCRGENESRALEA